ncbi:MAG: hypothetical protein OZ948_15880 [Deltaproteobacteria bacterium]|nr:hypothetical protein [Deltaproteobacteria bacterium]
MGRLPGISLDLSLCGATSRGEVLQWEARRVTAVARKLGVPLPTSDISSQRQALLDAKLSFGSDRLRRRLASEVRWSDRMAHAMVAIRPAARRTSVCRIRADSGTATEFSAWLTERMSVGDAAALLGACPDHYVIEQSADRGQVVLETTGGSPLAALFYIDYEDVSSLVTPADPAFSYQIAGVARAEDGAPIGGVRHQFRDVDTGGFEGCLTVEFPRFSLPFMLREHEWHLACEFSNWIEASLQ